MFQGDVIAKAQRDFKIKYLDGIGFESLILSQSLNK